MKKVVELRAEFMARFRAVVKDTVSFWEEFQCTEQGDKRVRGPHIVVSVPNQPSVQKKRDVYALFAEHFADLKPRTNFPCKVHTRCGVSDEQRYMWSFSFNIVESNYERRRAAVT